MAILQKLPGKCPMQPSRTRLPQPQGDTMYRAAAVAAALMVLATAAIF